MEALGQLIRVYKGKPQGRQVVHLTVARRRMEKMIMEVSHWTSGSHTAGTRSLEKDQGSPKPESTLKL